ncbi:hypothetical protein [Nonomuraea sp. NPDC049625]|uniref:hypothetical protein n=1 Tax=Nonomuraea sp. NPDC049625 TaxID=3155775 RepID=UPI00341B4D7D
MIDLAGLIRSFADLLRPCEGNADRLDAWIPAADATHLPHLHSFIRGLAQDHDAVILPFHNGAPESVNTKTKSIM